MNDNILLTDIRDGIAVITLNRPEVYNAFDATMQDELSGIWRALRRNDDVRVAVLTASGDKAFCVGIDRNEDGTIGETIWPAEGSSELMFSGAQTSGVDLIPGDYAAGSTIRITHFTRKTHEPIPTEPNWRDAQH